MTRTEDGNFTGARGQVVWRSWLPDGPVRAAIVLVHGVAEHGGRYGYVGETLATAGFAVFAPDHHGHGRSAGKNANIGSMSEVADDVAAMLSIARAAYPEVPRFLLGHSMGSLIVLYLATRGPLDVAGIVLSAPPLDIPVGNALQRAAAPVLTRLAPGLGVLQLDSSTVSRDPAVIRDYDTDPLNYRGKLPVRTGAEILSATKLVKQRLGQLTLPALVLHGTMDTLAAPSGSDLIERSAASADLTVRRYDGLFHEVFNEPERDQVLADVRGWLDAHLAPAQQ